ncbi:methyl-accepting chemotaxis protein [Janthinobacterium sp. PC23-8]|uniref:methyl-accepting chemotaxis protein n=1 Tax=Janthinobacterium sp. PC23-8 TaxID=2012679 RepID=UPI000B96A993|nr:methyl-accepting chemotaxis protein [Janthinobacterium sp. PC23-8]OYO25867.1 chemotaxis protein [Janthinobacterium sp. PC23-8]
MSIKQKIWALPLISTAVFALGLAVSTYLVFETQKSIHATETVDYPLLDTAKALTADIGAISDALRDSVAEGDKNRLSQLPEQAARLRVKLKTFGQIDGQSANGAQLTQQFEAYFAPALRAARIMLEVEQGDPASAVTSMQSALKTLNANLLKTNEEARHRFSAGIVQSQTSVGRILVSSIAVALIVIGTLAGASFFVVRTIWQQLGGEPEYTRAIARAVADGDLSMEIHTDPKDSGSLLLALKDMRDKLGSMVSEIKRSAETINVASHEIAAGNADLAARTESQAGSVDQTSRSMQTLTVTVRENADNANQANSLALSARAIATKGGKLVHEVVATMGAINGSATKIVDIIAVIDGIAFQTNILALNAAVEAARAGEQGRGFAVVASEVRNLAQRSAGAAREIKELIGDSVAKIGIGSKLVDEAGVTMGDIVESVRKVADIMSDITAATRAQTGGIESIGQAIESIDGMTQQNSALVEQASAAAESLREQTAHLSEVLSVFKLDARHASAPAAMSVAPASTGKVVALRPAPAGRTLLTGRRS